MENAVLLTMQELMSVVICICSTKATPLSRSRPRELGQLVSLTLIAEKMEQIILEIISEHMKDKHMIRNSHHGFAKGKSYFISLITLYDATVQ